MKINIVNLGMMDYKEAMDIQSKIFELRKCNKVDDTLIIVEHYPVLTLGKRGKYSNILASDQMLQDNKVSIYEIERGGDVTYHGPGQIVGYPILDLRSFGRDVRGYVGKIQEFLIELLKDIYEIEATKGEDTYTGVWVNDEKIMAIGVAISRWITRHGFAFNVNTDMEHFKWIQPCGITDKGVTSLKTVTGNEHDMEKMKKLVIEFFCKIFGYSEINKIDDIESFINE